MAKNTPKHIAIIMDGNRRWAQKKGLPKVEGHRLGYNTVKNVTQWCLDRGIKVLTVWAFSTENWNRSKYEVGYLMMLLKQMVKRELKSLVKKNVKVNFLGRIEELPGDVRKEIKKAVAATKHNTKAILNIAFNYGGRAEIVDAVKKVIADGIASNKITDKLFSKYLYTADMPDPDLIIRTSGEQRLSGYLPWQGAYAELYFTPKFWPDFSEKDFDAALDEFRHRKRNFGG